MFADDYSYKLPKELIANAPAEPRDAARLLVYSTATDEIAFDTFANLSRYIPTGSVLVLNDTKVVPARLQLMKPTGGIVNILLLVNEWNGGETIKGLPDRAVQPGEALTLVNRPILIPLSHTNEEFVFKLAVTPEELRSACALYGRTPLPPYKASNKPVVAAGTTAVRLLETAADAILAGRAYDGETTLFIRPPFPFKVTDALITNFHLPGTSLLALVDAFMQTKMSKKTWRDIYEIAVRDRFRFYSFGDAMLIL